MGTKLNLSQAFPALAREWDFEKNAPLVPDEVTPGSHLVVWWVCKAGHSFDSAISKRTGRNSGCKYCSGKALAVGINDLATTNPELAKQWHPTANGDLTPRDLQRGSSRKVFWLCQKGHTFESSVANRTAKKPTSCSICSGQKVSPGENDLQTLRPDIAAQWHGSLNGSLKPTEVTVSSSKKVFWQCLIDERHYWQARVYALNAGSGCGVCRGLVVIPGVNDVLSTDSSLMREWDYEKNELDPRQISRGSSKIIWWKCVNNHSWSTPLYSRTLRGLGCRVCAGHKAHTGENDLATTHPKLLAEWDFDANPKISPTEVIAGTNKKINWKCALGHKWPATGNHRVQGQQCPYCSTGGYEVSKPGLLYYIENPQLGASKIGITNTTAKTKRLEGFQKLGWIIVTTISSPDGAGINAMETRLLTWIRKDLGVPPYLTKNEIGKIAGWSETFSTHLVDRSEVLSRISNESKGL